MGLDLFCDGVSERVGSYGYVHVQRWAWICANRDYDCCYLDEQEKAVVEEKWNRCLLRQGTLSPVLDYEYIRKTMKSDMLPGVFTFVYHSDADGYWSDSECQSMLEAIQKLRPFFKRIPQLKNEMDENDEYYLEPIFRHSSKTGASIHLG